MERGGLAAAAGAVPALRADVSGAALLRQQHRWAIPLLYLPGLALLGIQLLALRFLQASELRRWNLDRLHWWSTWLFVAAAAVLVDSYQRASTPILRQQLKWITRGTILAITPFTLFYVLPYLFGSMPSLGMKVSVLSLGLLPLTFGYAIFRYRLMDVDLIFKRGMAYTLAAAAMVMLTSRGWLASRNWCTRASPVPDPTA